MDRIVYRARYYNGRVGMFFGAKIKKRKREKQPTTTAVGLREHSSSRFGFFSSRLARKRFYPLENQRVALFSGYRRRECDNRNREWQSNGGRVKRTKLNDNATRLAQAEELFGERGKCNLSPSSPLFQTSRLRLGKSRAFPRSLFLFIRKSLTGKFIFSWARSPILSYRQKSEFRRPRVKKKAFYD